MKYLDHCSIQFERIVRRVYFCNLSCRYNVIFGLLFNKSFIIPVDHRRYLFNNIEAFQQNNKLPLENYNFRFYVERSMADASVGAINGGLCGVVVPQQWSFCYNK
jgi:hypothetical protein